MPKKSETPSLRQLVARSSPYTGPSLDSTSLAASARRRLQFSQLPVKSKRPVVQRRLVPALGSFTPKRCASATKTCISTGIPVPRRSLSMIDLAQPKPADLRSTEINSENSSTSGDSSEHGCEALRCQSSSVESRAASLICRALAINAWRRRRAEGIQLAQQLDHLHIQLRVLRRLLDNENARVTDLAAELHRAKSHADEAAKERDQLRHEKETAEGEAQKLREISEERLVTTENLRNELKTARDQLDVLDKQISKDRDKLLKLREDKKILFVKLSASEALATEREASAAKAVLSLEDSQMQLATQISLNTSLQEELQRCSNTLKEKEIARNNLEDKLREIEKENAKIEQRLRESEETERALNLRTMELESQLARQDSNMRQIETAYSAQVLELNDLRERFLRQSQESGWSSKVLQLAGSVVRAPRVILRTLHFFTTGIPL